MYVTDDVRGVLFDLDGTLLDHERAVAGGLVSWLSTYGVSTEEINELVPAWFEAEARHYPAWSSGEISVREQRRRRLRDFLPLIGESPPEDALDSAYDEFLRAYAQNWIAFDDALPALQRISEAGIKIGVLTNGLQATQSAKLEATGLRDACGEVFASSELPAAKPDPRSYLTACQRLGIPASHTLMVGGSYDLDVLGARAAGLNAIHLDRQGTESRPESSRISTLGELRA
jgi:putative hydrolase of the HAD superfamily